MLLWPQLMTEIAEIPESTEREGVAVARALGRAAVSLVVFPVAFTVCIGCVVFVLPVLWTAARISSS